MGKIASVSFSAIETYQKCPRKYRLSYIDKITRTRFESSATSMGSAVHNGMAFVLGLYDSSGYQITLEEIKLALIDFYQSWYETNVTGIREDDADYDKKVQDLQDMVGEAFLVTYRTVQHLDVPNNWSTAYLNGEPLIEKRLTVDLPEHDTVFNFQIDWVAFNLKDGQVYLIDWKTRQKFQETEEEALIIADNFNVQISLYHKALQLLGLDVTYTMTYQITPSSPKTPVVTQNGKGRVSLSKIKTDWDTYSLVVRQNGEDPDDPYYAGVKEWASANVWWQPIVAHRSQTELDNRWFSMLQWVTRIQDDHIFPQYESAMCRYCPFNKLCFAEVRGFDTESIIDLEYSYKVVINYELEQEQYPDKDIS